MVWRSFAVGDHLRYCTVVLQSNQYNLIELIEHNWMGPKFERKKTTLLLLVRPSSMNLLVRNVNLQVRYKVSRDLAQRFMMIRQTAVFRGMSVK